MRKLIGTLVVLAVLAAVVDRVADHIAEGVVARNVAATEHLTSRPQVSIHGFPFLTQFARGRYAEVSATSADLTAGTGARQVRLGRVTFTFHDVGTNRDFTRFHARRGEATATVPYATLGKALDLRLRYAGGGAVVATREVVVVGRSYSPSFTVRPRALDGALGFTNAALAGEVPPAAAQVIRDALQVDLPLTGLPFDVHLDSLRATRAGIVLRLSGRDLTYRR